MKPRQSFHIRRQGRAMPGSTCFSLWVERSSTISRLKKIFAGVLELLREIGDENAYARHLSAHAVAHSPAEWRKFSDERFRAKYQKAKCC